VEPEFYERASSPLLPEHQLLGRLGRCETMVLNWIDAPQLRKEASGAEELLRHGRAVVEQIGAIGGEPPVYLDVSTPQRWSAEVDTALEKIVKLHQDGLFQAVSPEALRRLREWAAEPEVVDAVTRQARIVHGDLKADQVLVAGEEYKVVDWQRPLRACPELDLVAMLVGAKLDPFAHLDRRVVQIFWMLRLHWATEAQLDLFPDFRGPLFNGWAAEAVTSILAG
jgi:hypothetical protein